MKTDNSNFPDSQILALLGDSPVGTRNDRLGSFNTGQIVRWKKPNADESFEDRMRVIWCDRERTQVELCGFTGLVRPLAIVATSDLEAA